MFACGLANQKGHVACVDKVKVFEQILFESVEAGHFLACLLAHIASNPLVLVSQIRRCFTYTSILNVTTRYYKNDSYITAALTYISQRQQL